MKPRTDILLNAYLVIFLALSAWVWSVVRNIPLYCFSVGAVLLLLGLLSLVAVGIKKGKKIHFDPIVPIGLLLLSYAAIQAWNGGRVLYFNFGFEQWRFTAPPHQKLPFSYNTGEAFRFFLWFMVAWIIILAVRFLVRNGNPKYLRRSLIALVINASILVCYGVFKFYFSPKHMFGFGKVNHRVFATFPYVNHAAAYFVLMAALAAGLLMQQIISAKTNTKPKSKWGTILLLACTFFGVVGANFSLSRAGIILAWSLTALGAIYVLIRSWHNLKPAARVNMTAATLATVAVFYFFISGFGSKDIQKEFQRTKQPVWQLAPQLTSINLDLTVRPQLWQTGWDVFASHWLYGTGGWGYRHAAPLVVPEEEWDEILKPSGRAYVHNDPIQFLSEFGVVGTSIMLLGLAILIWPIFYEKMLKSSLGFMLGLGLLLVYIFSIVDLPFRCPAVLWTWVALLAWIPGAHKLGKEEIAISKTNNYNKNPWLKNTQLTDST